LLFYAIRSISEAHHGGAIIVIPYNKHLLDYQLDIKYKCSYNNFLEEYIENYASNIGYEKNKLLKENERVYCILHDFKIDFLYFSNLLSSLANVDGAILINDRFELLGFGAEIQCLDESLNMVDKFDPEQKYSQVLIKDNGTRYRSAFRFVQKYHEAFILLSSQDGGMKCIGFNEKTKKVTMWEDLING
jgi:hypothetical protein